MTSDTGTRLSAAGVWECVLSLLGNCADLVILDAPAGRGDLSKQIRKQGGIVVSLDIDHTTDRDGIWATADLNKILPFKDESFNTVVSVEGIEHLENPSFVFREFARIVKDQGVLILTTPNVVNIRSRLKFLLTGNLFWFDRYALHRYGHITPLALYQALAFSERAGFKTELMTTNRRVLWMRLLSPFFILLGKLFKNTLNSPFLLYGEILILKLRKLETG